VASRDEVLAPIRAWWEGVRDGDVQRIVETYAEDAVSISPMFGEARGRAAIGRMMTQLIAAFGPAGPSTSKILVDGDRVAVLTSVTTIDRTGLFGRAATGQTIDYRLVVLFTVAGGKIVHEERIYDSVGVMERLEKGRIDKELGTAAEVQRALLSRTAHVGAFCESIGDSVPCRAIGGDFFEFIELPSGRVGVAMGDIAGKGPAAALLAAMLQGMLVSEAGAERGPGATLSSMNRQLAARAVAGRFATLAYVVISPDGRLVYANGGHNAPAIVGSGSVQRLDATGPILGMFPDATFDEEALRLGERETLVMFTDGVTEARNRDDEEFGEDRLLACIAAESASAPAVMLAKIFGVVREFSEGVDQADEADDITVTVTRRSA
jgi:ketosteroid isomerase-like protein